MIRAAHVLDESIVDGEGLRLVVFAQGCAHHCPGCHNPSALPFEGGSLIDNESILNKIRKNPLLDGITFSGGDPFFQIESFASLAAAIREDIPSVNPDFTIMAYTGYTLEELFEDLNRYLPLLEKIDILVDGPYMASRKSLDLPFMGSLNQRILDVKRSLLTLTPVPYIPD